MATTKTKPVAKNPRKTVAPKTARSSKASRVPGDAELALELHSVVKYLDGKEVLCGVSLKVGRGEVFGFLGPNGAGKTTTMKTILSLISPDG
jgi:ABC-2 type transport system ATP-binding protein